MRLCIPRIGGSAAQVNAKRRARTWGTGNQILSNSGFGVPRSLRFLQGAGWSPKLGLPQDTGHPPI